MAIGGDPILADNSRYQNRTLFSSGESTMWRYNSKITELACNYFHLNSKNLPVQSDPTRYVTVHQENARSLNSPTNLERSKASGFRGSNPVMTRTVGPDTLPWSGIHVINALAIWPVIIKLTKFHST